MELRQYVSIIFKWWWLIVLSVGIAAAASYYSASRQTRLYQTSTTLMVGQVIQVANPSTQDFFIPEQLAGAYAQIARRQLILQAVVDSLDLKMSWQALRGRVNINPIARTQLLQINVTDTSPERAVLIADEIARQLILQSPSSPENSARQERGTFVHEQLDDLEGRIKTAQQRIVELKAELDEALSARKIQDLQLEISNLEILITGWQANYTELLGFLEGSSSPNNLTVIEPAQLSWQPVSPNVRMTVMIASAFGLVLAVAGIFLLEYLDDTVKTLEDLRTALGLVSLASIGFLRGEDDRERLINSHGLLSPDSEAYRLMRTNLQFISVENPLHSILITGPGEAIGKSTTVANLAIIMAQANLRTVIVDSDLRRPVIHRMFNLPNVKGLTNLLMKDTGEIDGYLQTTDVENLQVITSGPIPPNPSELLNSQRMTRLLRQLESQVDVLLLDSSPIFATVDSLVLSAQVDGVILVTRAGRTRREAAKQATQQLEQAGANLLGGIVNGVKQKNQGAYYSYYTYQTLPAQQHNLLGILKRKVRFWNG